MRYGTVKKKLATNTVFKNSRARGPSAVPTRLTASLSGNARACAITKKILSKRFTDTKIWHDSWYRKLPLHYREAWRYILDNCDNTGVWKVDFELLRFFCGGDFETTSLLSALNESKERILILKDGLYWLVKDFISFQFGELSLESRVHKSILKLLRSHSLSIGYPKGIYTLKDKDKDKDKEKDLKEVKIFAQRNTAHFAGCACPRCK